MKKIFVVVALVVGLAVDAHAQTQDRSVSGSLGPGNNTTVTISLAGYSGVGVNITTTDLNATVIPEISYDGGASWIASSFLNTAAANVVWQLFRSTTASSAGVAITAEATTGAHSVSKMDPGDSNWSGLARTGGTEGTSGAILDGGNIYVNIAATGSSQQTLGEQCKEYGLVDGKQPIVAAGLGSGVKLMFAATAGGTGQAASIHFVAN